MVSLAEDAPLGRGGGGVWGWIFAHARALVCFFALFEVASWSMAVSCSGNCARIKGIVPCSRLRVSLTGSVNPDLEQVVQLLPQAVSEWFRRCLPHASGSVSL